MLGGSALAVACGGDDNNGTGSDAGNGGDSALVDTGSGGDSTLPDGGGTDGPAIDAADATPPPVRYVYVESNDITANMNSVLVYKQIGDGPLAPITGSPFLTGGTGVGNPTQGLGPDDTDQEIILSPDGKKLYAVNAGSNTIAVFDVKDDGSLSAITGSPFPAGGINPVSLGVAGSNLFVVLQDQDPAQDAAVGSAGYATLPILASGGLGALTALTPSGKSPQIALTTADGKLLFGTDFMAPLANAQGPLRAFAINGDGSLTAAPGTPMAIPAVDGGTPPGTPLALGLAVHPTQKILYVGFVLRSQIGVYSYDGATGALTYVTNTTVSGPAPCWIRANPAGTRLYVTNTADNSVSVLDTSTPLAPTEIQHLVLADPGPLYDAGTMSAPTSETFEMNLSPDGKYLFVLSQNTNPDPAVTTGNVLHALTVGADGKLTETVADVKLTLPAGVRPQGVLVR